MASSSTPLVSYWHPDITYDFTLRIGENDYSTDLVNVEIRSASNIPYQQIFFDVFMDSRDLLSEELYGQQAVKFIIRLKGKQPETLEEIVFDLMYIDTEGGYAPVQKSYITDQWERSMVRFKCVCSKPYQTMSREVNEVFINATPYSIIDSLVKETGAELNYDFMGRSTLSIDQLLIPPTTLYRVVKYLNRTYGVFDGALGFHCSFDNKVKVQNLSSKTRNAQTFTLYLIASDRDNKDIFEQDDPNFFYTKTAVTNSFKGNGMFANLAPTRKYIVKPSNTLFKTIDVNLQSFAKKYGIIERNNDSIYYNSLTIDPEKRISYHKDMTGYDTDQTFINATLAPQIADMSVTVAQITGNLPTLNLMEVGEAVKIVSHVDDHLKLAGMYVLKGSTINFTKAGKAWESSAMIYMSRTNIAMQ